MGLAEVWLFRTWNSPGGVGRLLLGVGADPPAAVADVPAAPIWLHRGSRDQGWRGRALSAAGARGREAGRTSSSGWGSGLASWPREGTGKPRKEQPGCSCKPPPDKWRSRAQTESSSKPGSREHGEGGGRTWVGISFQSKEGAEHQRTGPNSGWGTPGSLKVEPGLQTTPALVGGHSTPCSDWSAGKLPRWADEGLGLHHTNQKRVYVLLCSHSNHDVRASYCLIPTGKLCLELTSVLFCFHRTKVRAGRCRRVFSFIRCKKETTYTKVS